MPAEPPLSLAQFRRLVERRPQDEVREAVASELVSCDKAPPAALEACVREFCGDERAAWASLLIEVLRHGPKPATYAATAWLVRNGARLGDPSGQHLDYAPPAYLADATPIAAALLFGHGPELLEGLSWTPLPRVPWAGRLEPNDRDPGRSVDLLDLMVALDPSGWNSNTHLSLLAGAVDTTATAVRRRYGQALLTELARRPLPTHVPDRALRLLAVAELPAETDALRPFAITRGTSSVLCQGTLLHAALAWIGNAALPPEYPTAICNMLRQRPSWLEAETLGGSGNEELHLTPLMLAARLGQAGIVPLLLEHGADPEAKDARALTLAASDDVRRMLQAKIAERTVATTLERALGKP